jgi:hypothetical protein
MDVTFVEQEVFFKQTQVPVQGENMCEQDPGFLTHQLESFSQPSQQPNMAPVEGQQNMAELDLGPNTTELENQTNGAEIQNSINTDNVWDMQDRVNQPAENETVIQSDSSPQVPCSPEDNPEVSSLEIFSKLPPRVNREKPPKRYVPEDGTSKEIRYPIANYTTTEKLSKPLKEFSDQISVVKVPNNLEEALEDPKWVEAMEVEMDALRKSGTWKLIELPKGKKTVGCKWVFSVKYNAEGKIERYKARLVAKGYTQTCGIDFQETFSPVAKLNTIRVLLSLAANHDWPLH